MNVIEGDTEWTVDPRNFYKYAVVKIDNGTPDGIWVRVTMWYGILRDGTVPTVESVVSTIHEDHLMTGAQTSRDNPLVIRAELPHGWR